MSTTAPAVYPLVCFQLGDEAFGVELALVQEIVHLTGITRVPNAPAHVEGVVNLRGRIVPVVDLRKKLGLAPGEPGRRSRIIIVAAEGRTVGLIVDGVREVRHLPAELVEPAPELATTGLPAGAVLGVGKLPQGLLVLLDLARVLAGEAA